LKFLADHHDLVVTINYGRVKFLEPEVHYTNGRNGKETKCQSSRYTETFEISSQAELNYSIDTAYRRLKLNKKYRH